MKDSPFRSKESTFESLQERYKVNYKNMADGLKLMSEIKDNAISVVFFDPQYRGVLDKLKYGNEGKGRCVSRCTLQQMDRNKILLFLWEIDRVLKRSGHLFLWVDKYHLCEDARDWFAGTELKLVDLITWNKGRIGMGYRTRHASEYILIFQKLPVKAKACWKDHSIPDVWTEKVVKPNHPHSKPIELQKRLIAATTSEGDYVLDPAAGGYSVFEACKSLNRIFIGADILQSDA